MDWILTHKLDLLHALTAVVAAAAALTALTPSPADDGVVAKVRAVLNFLAFNFGHAKNKD
jgi:delta-aminolevulinic acid dehydratase/porphobilinogen synthase